MKEPARTERKPVLIAITTTTESLVPQVPRRIEKRTVSGLTTIKKVYGSYKSGMYKNGMKVTN